MERDRDSCITAGDNRRLDYLRGGLVGLGRFVYIWPGCCGRPIAVASRGSASLAVIGPGAINIESSSSVSLSFTSRPSILENMVHSFYFCWGSLSCFDTQRE